MLCYVMLCYVMLCYVMLCYVMLCYVMLCCVMLHYFMLCFKIFEEQYSNEKELNKGMCIFFQKQYFLPKIFSTFLLHLQAFCSKNSETNKKV